MNAIKNAIKDELLKVGLKSDESCLKSCLELYSLHGFESVAAFVSAVDAHAFNSGSKALNPDFFSSFGVFLSSQQTKKVDDYENDDFFASDDDGLDFLGIAGNSAALATPPLSPIAEHSSPITQSDRKRKSELTTPTTRTKPPATPW